MNWQCENNATVWKWSLVPTNRLVSWISSSRQLYRALRWASAHGLAVWSTAFSLSPLIIHYLRMSLPYLQRKHSITSCCHVSTEDYNRQTQHWLFHILKPPDDFLHAWKRRIMARCQQILQTGQELFSKKERKFSLLARMSIGSFWSRAVLQHSPIKLKTLGTEKTKHKIAPCSSSSINQVSRSPEITNPHLLLQCCNAVLLWINTFLRHVGE